MEPVKALRGSCLCGGVRYEISGPLRGVLNCHCSMCRKAHGAAFRTRASVQAADFRWVLGEDLVTYYESSPGNHRGFCRSCTYSSRTRRRGTTSPTSCPASPGCRRKRGEGFERGYWGT